MDIDPTLESYTRLSLAFGIGLMVGIERGWRARERADGSRAAGLRTFTLMGLFGGIVAVLQNDWVLIAGFFAITTLLATAYFTGLSSDPDRSITGEVAGLATFALGALAVRGDMVLAAALGVVLVSVLASREWTHNWIRQIEKVELKAAIQLLIISVVVLPVLPNRGYGPGGVINPFELWWVVVIVAAISFAAMAAVKVLGPRAGLLWTGILGGLASSTAVAVSCARLAKGSPALNDALSAAIAAATGVKFIRTGLIAFLIFPAGAVSLAPSLLLAAIAAMACALVLLRRQPGHDRTSNQIVFGAASDLTVPLSFAAVLAIVTLGVYFGNATLGNLGVLAVSALSGLVDVDAITVSAGRQSAAGATATLMAQAVVVALGVNTIAKAVYVFFIAGRALFNRVAVIGGSALLGLGLGLLIS